ncbi:MAG: hypothetical protein WA864_08015 [Acetobacteraceae bacterium]|jgi:hypothetical protein
MSQLRPLLKTLPEIRLGLDVPEALVLVILTMASGYWTYLGVTELNPEATDWFSRAGAAVLAVAVTAGLFLFWRAVILQLPHYTGVRLAVAVPVVVGGAMMVVGISSYLNFTGMVGHEAMRAEMQQQLTALAEETTKATEAAQRSLKIADDIRLQAANYRNIEASERNLGGFTARPGLGPVQGMLAQAAASFDEAQRQAREKEAEFATLTTRSQEQLASLRAIITQVGLSSGEMSGRFAAAAEVLRLTILRLSSIDFGHTLHAAADAAQNAVRPSGIILAPEQRAALDGLSQQLAEMQRRIDTELKFQGPAIPLLAEPVRVISIFDATLHHALNFVPLLLVAIAIDVLPLPLLAMAMNSGWQIRADRRGVPPEESLTAADLLRAAEVLSHLINTTHSNVPWPDPPSTPWQRQHIHAVPPTDGREAA